MRKILISALILFYVYGAALWLAAPSDLRTALLRPVRGAFNYLALWQEFAVFSPEPRSVNLHITADVLYQDGTSKQFDFPWVEHCTLVDKCVHERMRKFALDYLNGDDQSFLWPDFAKFIALKAKAIPHSSQPVAVRLIRYWSQIPPPTPDNLKHLVIHENTYCFYMENINESRVCQNR